MKGLIIYASCYGSTKTYAEWISEETGMQVVSYKEATDKDIENTNTIVIGSWVLAHKLFLKKWLTEKKELLKGKKLYVFSVSGAKPGDKELDHVFSDSLDAELLKDCKTYQFGGRRETKKMSGFHKFMMFIAAAFIEKDKEKKAEMKRYVDNVDRKYINVLMEDLQ
ncbi:MAG: hypothetical protein JW811_01170 [Clostridiales bacterium]|nr:hypothetical protein [Clostridiales bacterium]